MAGIFEYIVAVACVHVYSVSCRQICFCSLAVPRVVLTTVFVGSVMSIHHVNM